MEAAAHTGHRACSHMVRVSHWSTGQERWAPCTGHSTQATLEQKNSLWNVFTLKSTALPPWAALQGLTLSRASSPVGHLWADLSERTLARETLILKISPSPASRSCWWQLVQKSETVTPASSKWVNATKPASDYCPGPTWWKGRTISSWVILSPIYDISPLELFKSYFHFYCNQPRSDNQRYCLLLLSQTHLGSVYQNSAAGQSLYLLNLKGTSPFHCPSPPFILEDPTDRRQAAK